MKVDEFIRQYKESAKKEQVCERHINKKYLPYANKIAECNKIVENTMNILNEDGTVSYKQNTPARFLLFHMRLISNYTDIELENENFINDYDALNESGAFTALITKIPESEYKEFNTLLSMTVDDFMGNNRTIFSCVENLVTAIMLSEKETPQNE